MNKSNKLHILDNADDNIIDQLSSFPVLTENEKERMFVMSKRKLNKLRRNISMPDTQNDPDETSVNGSEHYRRTFSYKPFLTVAACLVVAVGAAGTVHMLKNSGGGNGIVDIDPDPASSAATENTESTAVTEGRKNVTVSKETVPEDEYENIERANEIIAQEKAEAERIAEAEREADRSAEEEIAMLEMQDQIEQENCKTIALELMNALDKIDRIGGGAGLAYDDSINPYYDEDGNIKYAKVTDTQFGSTFELRNYMDEYFTENLIDQRYSDILDTDEPRCIDYDDSLYIDITRPRGCGFFWADSQVYISDVTYNSFTAVAEYEDFGAVSRLSMNIVLEDSWKIDSFERMN
ncbi:MAG: hypothetical protein ACI4I9_00305 [Porcipelethomonas sp.]